MRIVSQSRDTSINFDEVIINTDNNGLIFCHFPQNPMLKYALGTYGNIKRAKEVFEDIHKAYAPIYSISDGLTEEQLKAMVMPSKNVIANNIVNTGPEMCLTTYDNYVYYMPEE